MGKEKASVGDGASKGKARNFKLTEATMDRIKAIARQRSAETGVECSMTDAVKHAVHNYGIGSKAQGPVLLPDFGEVPCGTPIDPGQPAYVMVDVLSPLLRGEGRFLLTARGDSMTGKGFNIADGDRLIVQQQGSAEPGDTVIALVDGKTTVKKLATDPKKRSGEYLLVPANDRHETLPFRPENGDRIIGVVVGLVRKA